jgi:hypothetical protein
VSLQTKKKRLTCDRRPGEKRRRKLVKRHEFKGTLSAQSLMVQTPCL